MGPSVLYDVLRVGGRKCGKVTTNHTLTLTRSQRDYTARQVHVGAV